jgi:hypothetical protein
MRKALLLYFLTATAMPSEARHDFDRETKSSPLGKFATTRTRSRRKQKCKR